MEPSVNFPADWKAPRELARSLPRDVTLTGGGKALVVVGVLMLVGSVALAVFLWNKSVEQEAHAVALAAQGRQAGGQVTRLWLSGKSATPTLRYTFTVEGKKFEGEASAPRSRWDGLQVGSELPVRYVALDPAVNHPFDWPGTVEPRWLALLAPGILASCSVLFWILLRRESYLLAEGLAAPGVVTKLRRIKGGWAANYQFRMKDGTVGKGRSRVKDRQSEGAVICVVYNPENPRRNSAYPLCNCKVAEFPS